MGRYGLTCIELIEIVKANAPEPHFEVYDIAAEFGHEVIFTPAYIPLSNPIEKVWACVKNRIARVGGVKNVEELKKALVASVSLVTEQTWLGCYAKTFEWENLHLDADESIVVDTGGDDTIDGIEPSTGTVAAVSDDEEDE